MEKMKNIDFPKQRGCFVEINKKTGACSVVDYPTWSAKNGRFLFGDNKPFPDGMECETSFATVDEARAFCKEQNYVFCAHPRDDKDEPTPVTVEEEPAA